MRLLLALIVLLACGAIVLGANLALISYGQTTGDPVGQLTPYRLAQIEASIGPAGKPSSALSPRPRPHQHVASGIENDD